MTETEQLPHSVSIRPPGTTEWKQISADDDGPKTKEMLKATLMASLQMQHIVVLAGSGCSISAHGPSMTQLWDATVNSSPTQEATAVAKTVKFDLAKEKNIEAFLSKVEAYLQINGGIKAGKFLSKCRAIILEKCTEFLTDDNLKAHETFLHRLSRRRARDSRLKVFTTNYDLCFERAASNLGTIVIDGFSFGKPRIYDPRYFGYDIVRRSTNEEHANFLEGVFLLYKLHGSVNWARESDFGIVEKTNPKADEACIIYPAVGKYQQAFLQPHLEAISQYLAALRQPNTCLIVAGFGFNDDHLSEPLLAAARSNPHMRLIVADNSAKSKSDRGGNSYWEELFRLGEKGEDIWFVNSRFQEFAELIPDLKALTPEERLKKAVQGIASEKSHD